MNTPAKKIAGINREKLDALYSLSQKLSQSELSDKGIDSGFEKWIEMLQAADIADLVALISLLDTRDKNISREVKALREAVIAQVAYKNANLITETMKKLDTTATYLTYASIALGVLGTAAAIIQLIH